MKTIAPAANQSSEVKHLLATLRRVRRLIGQYELHTAIRDIDVALAGGPVGPSDSAPDEPSRHPAKQERVEIINLTLEAAANTAWTALSDAFHAMNLSPGDVRVEELFIVTDAIRKMKIQLSTQTGAE